MFKAHYGKLECYDEGQERAKIKECSSLECDSKITPGFRDHFKHPRHISCTVVTQIVIEYVLCSWVKKKWHPHPWNKIVAWNSGHVCCAKLLQLCTILCDPVDLRWQDSSVHGVLLSRILEWVAMSFGHHPNSGIKPMSLTYLALAGRLLTTCHLGSPDQRSQIDSPFLSWLYWAITSKQFHLFKKVK